MDPDVVMGKLSVIQVETSIRREDEPKLVAFLSTAANSPDRGDHGTITTEPDNENMNTGKIVEEAKDSEGPKDSEGVNLKSELGNEVFVPFGNGHLMQVEKDQSAPASMKRSWRSLTFSGACRFQRSGACPGGRPIAIMLVPVAPSARR